jgi:SAM-dependent methyltransferase
MKECSKSMTRRVRDPNFAKRYFVGNGVDIGGRPDPISAHRDMFSGMGDVRIWDLEDGDAQFMAGVPAESLDFVHSSHCLEHLVNPRAGLKAWFNLLKRGGHLIVTVPDEDLYEQGVFPSTYNSDHKWTFTTHKKYSWSDQSINVTDLFVDLGEAAEVIKMELISDGYEYGAKRLDQTMFPGVECAIEFIIRKRTIQELADRGRWRRSS